MTALQEVLTRLNGVRPSGGGYVARCPAHNDRHQSLSIGPGVDRDVVVTCHACQASADDIVISVGLDPREVLGARANGDVVPFRPSRAGARRPAVASRTPWNVQGYRHVKVRYEDGSKSFFWEHFDEGAQRWVSGLPKGVRGEDLLYGAEDLAQQPDGAAVVLCEGETAADALRAAGIPAVASVTGASGTPSATALRQLLRFNLVLWRDNDEPGHGHMQRTAERLVSLGHTPRWVIWPNAPAKGDAADAPPEERSALVSAALPYNPEIHSSRTTNLEETYESSPLFITASEFAATTPATPEWVLWCYVALSAITEVAGKLKASGKTTWLLAMCRAVLDGQPFLGFQTVKTGVVYLTEQAGSSFRAALARADLLDRDDFVILFWNRARGLEWPVIVEAATAECKRRGFGVIVVDTLPQFSGVSGDNENSAGAALDAMKPLQAASAEGLAIVVTRHERKGGGEVGESGRGSSAYSGAVDIVLSIRRAEGQAKETVRVIQALSRFDDTPSELVVDLVDGEYRSLGTSQDVKAQTARTAILEHLPSTQDDAVTTKELLEALDGTKLGRTLIFQVLEQLRDAGVIQHVGEGRRGSPFRYYRSQILQSLSATVVAGGSISDVVDEVM